MSAAADARGLKRACADCGIRFYDMNKRPVVCPNCGTEFTGVIKVKTRRGRVAKAVEDAESQVIEAKAKKVANDDSDDDEITPEEGLEVVSLDDASVEQDDNDIDGDDVGMDLDDDDLGDLDDDDLGDLDDLDDDALEEETEESDEKDL